MDKALKRGTEHITICALVSLWTVLFLTATFFRNSNKISLHLYKPKFYIIMQNNDSPVHYFG